MSDEAAFMSAILAEPDEDTHRLVYADWLEERNEPGDAVRAEFIRVQIEVTRPLPLRPLPPTVMSQLAFLAGPLLGSRAAQDEARRRQEQAEWLAARARRKRCRIRERLLFDRHSHPHWWPAPDVAMFTVAETWPLGLWSRGFLSRVSMFARDWLAHGDAIRARCPVTRVRLISNSRTLGEFPLFSRGRLNEWRAVLPREDDQTPEVERWPGVTFELGGLRGWFSTS